MRLLFTGGGTLGPVTPLLAVIEEMKQSNAGALEIVWVGTRTGPEKRLVKDIGVPFYWMFAPKWRRQLDLRNIAAPFLFVVSCVWALLLLLWYRPRVIVTAGGYTGVSLVWMGYLLGMPSLLHNQDIRWSLSNRLTAPFARRITCVFGEATPARWRRKTVVTGNPVRKRILEGDKKRGMALCGFSEDLPVVMVLGGGTGARELNTIILEALSLLTEYVQVIHLTGKGRLGISARPEDRDDPKKELHIGRSERYWHRDFIGKEIGDLYAAADVVIARAGMGTLTELAALGKPAIIIPIPSNQQEDNALYFARRDAIIELSQPTVTSEKLLKSVMELIGDEKKLKALSENALKLSEYNAAELVADEIMQWR